jgi:hypothetical protein
MSRVLETFWQAFKREDGKKQPSASDAEFIGWQKTKSGDDFALYNVTAPQHPLYHSTVTETTLRRENLGIPPTPPQRETERTDHEQ